MHGVPIQMACSAHEWNENQQEPGVIPPMSLRRPVSSAVLPVFVEILFSCAPVLVLVATLLLCVLLPKWLLQIFSSH